jgi:hypothetical protein
MAYIWRRPRRGLGASTSGTSDFLIGHCGLFQGGVFKPECWCLDFPWLCSKEDYQAAVGVVRPTDIYPSGGLKPVGGAPPAPGGNPADPCAGRTGNDYYACTATLPGSLVDDKELLQQQRNQSYFENVADNLDRVGAAYDDQTKPGGLGMGAWVAIALVGVVGVAALGAGSPRRYGR